MNYSLEYVRDALCLVCSYAEEVFRTVQVFIGIPFDNIFRITSHKIDNNTAYN